MPLLLNSLARRRLTIEAGQDIVHIFIYGSIHILGLACVTLRLPVPIEALEAPHLELLGHLDKPIEVGLGNTGLAMINEVQEREQVLRPHSA